MEWDDLKTFLAIARHHNLSAAARALGVTQTTVGRRLDGMQDRIGVKLLQKTPTGYVLTAAGERILADVEQIETMTMAVERSITDEDVRLEGPVRVTTVESLAEQVLAPSLITFHQRYPGIVVELVTDPRTVSLSRREADIALRLGKFEQNDVIVRKLGEIRGGIYAAAEYLANYGQPDFAAGSPGHHKITPLVDALSHPAYEKFEEVTSQAVVALRSNSFAVQARAARAGLGLVGLPRALAVGLELLTPSDPMDSSTREVWLGVHRDMNHTPRIRAVIDHITTVMKRVAPELNPV